MPLLGLLILVLLVVGAVAIVIYSQREISRKISSAFKRNLTRVVLILIGLAIGITLASVPWSYSDTQRIIGIPIPVAAFEFRDGHWQDFVSPISLVIWVIDVLFWVGFVHVLIGLWFFIKGWRSRSSSNVL